MLGLRLPARGPHESDDFFVWIAGLDQLFLGLGMLLLPWQFGDPHSAALDAHLALYGSIFTLSGLWLVALQLLPTRHARIPQLSRFVGACAFALLALLLGQAHSWTGLVTYSLLGIGLLLTTFQGGWRIESLFRADLFMAVVATERLAYGTLTVALPGQALAPTVSLQGLQLFLWSLTMLLAGAALLVWQRRRDKFGRLLLPLLAAALMGLWTYEFGVRGGLLTTVVTTGLLAAGVVARPIVPSSWLAPRRTRLLDKLVVVVALSVGSALVVVLAALFRQTELTYNQRAELDLGAIADVVARDSTTAIEARMQRALLFSHDSEVLSFNPGVQIAFLRRVVQGDPTLIQLRILDRDGNVVASAAGAQPGGDSAGDSEDLDRPFRIARPVWDVSVSPRRQMLLLTVRIPIGAPDGSYAGMYVERESLSELTDQISALPFGRTGRIMIVDRQGQVIAHSNRDFDTSQTDFVAQEAAAALAGHASPVSYQEGNERWLVVPAPVPALGWTVLVERPEAEILAPASRVPLAALAVLTTMMLLAAGGATLFARSFSRPLVELARAAESLGNGSPEAELPPDGDDEVGDLVRAFRRMRRRLGARTRERDRLLDREEAARAEVEALLAATASLSIQGEPEAVLRTLVEQAAGLLEADQALYAMPRDDQLVIPARWLKGSWVDVRDEPRKSGVLGSVWETGRPYRTNDMAADPRANRELASRLELRTQLSVPLIGPDGQRLGIISLNNSRRREGFNERDQRMLVAICETGAAVLLRAQDAAARLEAEHTAARRKQEVEALLTAADQLNAVALEPQELLPQVLRVTAELLDVRQATIATNEDDHVLVRYEWSDGGCHPTNLRLPLEGSAAGWVIRERRAFRSQGGGAEVDGPSDGAEAPFLAVPIPSRDARILGVLTLSHPQDGQAFTEEDQRLSEGIAHHVAVALERSTLIQELRRREEHLRRQAVTDPLTGLPNRILFLDRLSHALAAAKRRSTMAAVLFLDLDGFKTVNDTLGHPTGDELLRAAAQRLVTSQRGDATLARFGGDEFAVLLEDVPQGATALKVADRIIIELCKPFKLQGRNIAVSASIGIAVSDGHSDREGPEDLLRKADIALYQAKAQGKNQAILFEPTMNTTAAERLELEAELRQAVDQQELRLRYQPFVDLTNGAVLGAEALLRWKHPRRGFLEPKGFIPIMEETGLIVPAGQWALHEACREAQSWPERQPDGSTLLVGVNVSARQLEQPEFVDHVGEALKTSGLFPGSLELELTESTLLRHPESVAQRLEGLRALGVRLAIDDFGTGYSSLDYLERLAPDRLKIDQSFVHKLHQDRSSIAIVRAVVSLAQALELDVTAEGIETAEQAARLRDLGCRYGQGSYFSGPLPGRTAGAAVAAGLLP